MKFVQRFSLALMIASGIALLFAILWLTASWPAKDNSTAQQIASQARVELKHQTELVEQLVITAAHITPTPVSTAKLRQVFDGLRTLSGDQMIMLAVKTDRDAMAPDLPARLSKELFEHLGQDDSSAHPLVELSNESRYLTIAHQTHQGADWWGLLPLSNALVSNWSKRLGVPLQIRIGDTYLTSEEQPNWHSITPPDWPPSVQIFLGLPNPSSALPWLSLLTVGLFVAALAFACFWQLREAKQYSQRIEAIASRLDNPLRLDGIDEHALADAVLKNDELGRLEHHIRLSLSALLQENAQLKNDLEHQLGINKRLSGQSSYLKKERDQAIRAPRTKSQFLSRMGDEITTPMNSVLNMLHLLSEYNMNEEPRELLNIAHRSARLLTDNLNNILDFSKLDANLLQLRIDPVDVRRLLNELAEEYRPHAKVKNLKLEWHVAHEVPATVEADGDRIQQVLANLVGNAIRFTKDGEVRVTARSVKQKGSDYLMFSVQDSGIGIPKEAQLGLFDSLEQRSRLTNSSFAGRLRLIVSKMLVELMGGTIGVESEQGKGSRFWFTVLMR